eukprot:CAMPEP_0179292896 /NCGR_PEP_ID=MMETSP0797-20121207/43093_1 /TAXON_ID=47934 /ORGANISM="Dinophysis acuminata, Strain DAEP01" /LENGTH=543 /DNA_ID=CAMNT_0021002025 /DNA_START=1 /DNA_END=1632 /DNA_ORIENTATION=+
MDRDMSLYLWWGVIALISAFLLCIVAGTCTLCCRLSLWRRLLCGGGRDGGNNASGDGRRAADKDRPDDRASSHSHSDRSLVSSHAGEADVDRGTSGRKGTGSSESTSWREWIFGGPNAGVPGKGIGVSSEPSGPPSDAVSEASDQRSASWQQWLFGSQGWLNPEAITTQKEIAKARFLEAMGPMRQQAMRHLVDMVKDTAVSDPDMWPCMRQFVRSSVEEVAKEVELEVDRTLKETVLRQRSQDTIRGAATTRWLCCCMKLRAFVLHHLYPHNRSIFGHVKDPCWLLLTLMMLITGYGVRTATLVLVLFMHVYPGPPDEFQLVHFIASLKSTQFVSGGIVMLIMGAMNYFYCISRFPDDLKLCVDDDSIGLFYMQTVLLDFLSNYALMWLALAALPASTKQQPNFVGRPSGPETATPRYCCCLRRRNKAHPRLKMFVFYDTACFTLSVVVLAVLTAVTCSADLLAGKDEDWQNDSQLTANIFWCRVLYSLLTFPFLVTVSPVATFHLPVLSRARPTGYNSQGACVTFLLPVPNRSSESGAPPA